MTKTLQKLGKFLIFGLSQIKKTHTFYPEMALKLARKLRFFFIVADLCLMYHQSLYNTDYTFKTVRYQYGRKL